MVFVVGGIRLSSYDQVNGPYGRKVSCILCDVPSGLPWDYHSRQRGKPYLANATKYYWFHNLRQVDGNAKKLEQLRTEPNGLKEQHARVSSLEGLVVLKAETKDTRIRDAGVNVFKECKSEICPSAMPARADGVQNRTFLCLYCTHLAEEH